MNKSFNVTAEAGLLAEVRFDQSELIMMLEGGEVCLERDDIMLIFKMEEENSFIPTPRNLEERYKTCRRCAHDGEGDAKIVGSFCYSCKRNPIEDNRIDWFEERKEEEDDSVGI